MLEEALRLAAACGLADADPAGSAAGLCAAATARRAELNEACLAARLRRAEAKAEERKDALERSEEDKLCAICLCGRKEVAFGPCGHQSCLNCSTKVAECHMCRAVIEMRLPIFG